MNKYKIFVSDNYDAENVKVYTIESDENEATIVKTIALQTIYDEGLDENDIEKMTFGSISCQNDKYGVIIQCHDFHICVWCDNSENKSISLNKDIISVAKSIEDDACYDIDDIKYDDEIKTVIDKINDILS